MSDPEQKGFVVLLGGEQLSPLFEEWPERMNLAVCLRRDGECRLQVFRQEEGVRVLPRLLRVMRMAKSDVSVFPEVVGYQARSMFFSEEKQVLSIVQNAPEIVEEAADYSVNYTFAVDEGLDPISFLYSVRERRGGKVGTTIAGVRPSKTASSRLEKWKNPGASQERAIFEAKPSSKQNLPRFLQPPALTAKPVVADTTQRNTVIPEPRFCLVQDLHDGWFGVELPGCAGKDVIVTKPGQIFVRDDRHAVVFGEQLIGGSSKVFPKRIRVNLSGEASLLGDVLRDNLGIVRARIQEGALLLELNNVRESKPAASLNPQKPPRKQPWKVWASAVTVAAALALWLQSVLPPLVSSDESDIDWSQYQRDGNSDTVTSFQGQLGLLDLTLKSRGG